MCVVPAEYCLTACLRPPRYRTSNVFDERPQIDAMPCTVVVRTQFFLIYTDETVNILGEKLRCIFRVIRQDNAGSSAPDTEQRLHHYAIALDPSILCGGLNHRVFSRDLIRG